MRWRRGRRAGSCDATAGAGQAAGENSVLFACKKKKLSGWGSSSFVLFVRFAMDRFGDGDDAGDDDDDDGGDDDDHDCVIPVCGRGAPHRESPMATSPCR